MEKLENDLSKQTNSAEKKLKNEITEAKTEVAEKKPQKNTETTTDKSKKSQNTDQTKPNNKIDQKEIEKFFKEKDSKQEKGSSNNLTDVTMQLVPVKEKSEIKKKLIVICLVLFAILVIALSTGFGVYASLSNKIMHGVSINGVDVSNLSKQEAIEKLNSAFDGAFNKDITFQKEDYTYTINASSIGAKYNIEKAVADAYSVGRNSNIFANNFNVLKALIAKCKMAPTITIDSDLLDKKFDELDRSIPNRVIQSNYKIDGDNLIITSGLDGNRIKRDEVTEKLCNALSDGSYRCEITTEPYHTDEIDIDAIYEEVYKEPVDATFQSNPYELHKEENGLDFAISINEARAMVTDRHETYTIPLKVLYPKVTVKTLPQEAFPDELATYSTTYASSNYNRSTNIYLAAKSVDGTVLMPDETFSYNETLGQRTVAKGYKEAGAYVNGQVSSEVGGGICQVSSTLYNAALLCNLEIVDRKNHSFEPSYVPAGQDATVSWKSPDFKFKNNRAYPIKLSATAGNGRVIFRIYGIKSDDDYEVKIQSAKTGSIPFSTQYVNDSSLPVGTTKVTQYGSNGCRTVTYKILYKNGQEVSRTLINSDTYNPHNQVVARGTKVVEVEQTPSQMDNEPNNSAVIVTNEPQ